LTWAAIAGGLLALGAGCSLILDSSPEQCTQTSDCAKFNNQALFVCENNACVQSTTVRPETGGTTSCSTNQECQTAGVADPGICDQTTQKCVLLKSPDCGEIVGDVNSDEVLLLGALLPKTLLNEQMGRAINNALILAAKNEFSAAKASLPRPVAVVICDDAANPERAARHLVTNLKVPAIIAAGTPNTARTVAEKVTGPASVFLLSSTSTPAGATNLEMWHTVANDEQQLARAISEAAVEYVDKKLVQGGMTSNSSKWAIVRKKDDYGTGLRTALNALQPFSSLGLRLVADVDYGNPESPATAPVNYSGVLATLAAALPDVVVVLGTSEAAKEIIGAYEDRSVATRPIYLVSNGLMVQDLLDNVAKYPALKERIFGVVPAANDETNTALRDFLSKYRDTFRTPDGKLVSGKTFGVQQTYDAFYALTYAASTVNPQQAQTGAKFKETLLKLTAGSAVPVGPANIVATLTKLKSNESIDLEGTSGPLDFQAPRGSVTEDIQLWCIGADGDFEYSGRSINKSRQPVGTTTRCPNWKADGGI